MPQGYFGSRPRTLYAPPNGLIETASFTSEVVSTSHRTLTSDGALSLSVTIRSLQDTREGSRPWKWFRVTTGGPICRATLETMSQLAISVSALRFSITSPPEDSNPSRSPMNDGRLLVSTSLSSSWSLEDTMQSWW